MVDREAIFERDGHRCVFCHLRGTGWTLTIDHLVPRARWAEFGLPGSWDHGSNLVTACRTCNDVKGAELLDGVAVEFGRDGGVRVRVKWQRVRFAMAELRLRSQRRRSVPRNLRGEGGGRDEG